MMLLAGARPDALPSFMSRTLAQAALKVPPFTSPRVRLEFLRRRAQLGRIRRRFFERLGSDRYSHPALFELDRKLEPYLPYEKGFFVEAGANDGYVQSNTYYLERFKRWSGVLVEPIPELYRECLIERPGSLVFNFALVPADYPDATVPMRYGGLMSLVEGARGSSRADEEHVLAGTRLGWDRTYSIAVPARTLSSILDEVGAPEVDLLSLDVEGYEAQALLGLDFTRHVPRYVLVEIQGEQERQLAVEAVLGDRYEAVEQLSPYDVLYRRTPWHRQ